MALNAMCGAGRASWCLGLAVLASAFFVRVGEAQPTFAVATIRPSAEAVKFEHDGKTETLPGTLRMRDVTVNTCIKWAFGVQDSQISGPGWMQADHFDINAKADGPVGDAQMKLMMRALLAERFKLSFHREERELKSFALLVAKGGPKLHEAADGESKGSMQNSEIGTVAKSTTMRELGDMLSGPLQTPVVDKTGLTGRYDFTIDFTNYLPEDKSVRPNVGSVMMAALQGELGLKLEAEKAMVEVMVVDHVEKPSEN
jgi:uncharacterized protein (TIGR03435 family)